MTSTRRSSALLTVGQAADRLGVAPSTLRTWERRYGMSPGGRSAGGHRRYRPADLAVLELMRELVLGGEAPSRAAALALRSAEAARAAQPDGPDAADGDGAGAGSADGRRTGADSIPLTGPDDDDPPRLAVPHAPEPVRRLAAAAVALEVDTCVTLVIRALDRDGVEATWDRLMRPVLVAAGSYWARTGQGVETEHLLTAACIEALSAYRRELPRPEARMPVLLSCAPVDQHSLPLHVVAAALAERRVPSRVLGPLVPAPAVVAAAQRTGARSAFVWAQLADPRNLAAAAELGASRPPLRVVLGGPGWDSTPPPTGCSLVTGLGEAAQALAPDVLGAARRRQGRAG